MNCENCNAVLKVTDFIKSDGTTNRPYDRVIAKCPKCPTTINTRYDPRDWYTKTQLRMIEKLMKRSNIEVEPK